MEKFELVHENARKMIFHFSNRTQSIFEGIEGVPEWSGRALDEH